MPVNLHMTWVANSRLSSDIYSSRLATIRIPDPSLLGRGSDDNYFSRWRPPLGLFHGTASVYCSFAG